MPEYRKYSPGEGMVDEAIGALKMSSYDNVIDFGCGTGRAGSKFQSYGIQTTGVDIAENCVETEIHFIRACLWEMPNLVAAFGYCTDVMEHIPTEMVEKTLEEIERCTIKGVFFQICLTKDRFGDKIGERLHLTVQPAEWWIDKLETLWKVKHRVRGNNLIAVCVPKT